LQTIAAARANHEDILYSYKRSRAAGNNRGNLALDVAATAFRMRVDANEAARFSFDGLQWHLENTLPAQTSIVQPPRTLSVIWARRQNFQLCRFTTVRGHSLRIGCF
jgi:hypothetical protein